MLKKWIKIPSEYNQKIKDLKIRELLSIKILEQDICVVMVDNELFAFSNYCPHGGALLSLGTCNLKGVISCPKHGYKFDCKTGKDLDNNGYHLKRHKIEKRIDDYWLFI
jgi:nitrite reductase/ring-hydroxylating ferredoxin subunit